MNEQQKREAEQLLRKIARFGQRVLEDLKETGESGCDETAEQPPRAGKKATQGIKSKRSANAIGGSDRSHRSGEADLSSRI